MPHQDEFSLMPLYTLYGMMNSARHRRRNGMEHNVESHANIRRCFLSAILLFASITVSVAQDRLYIARISDIPDQYIGGEILKVVYSRLGIAIELVDEPAQRALEDSSTGKLDGEVHRNISVQNQYPSLLIVHPAINYIEPSVFATTCDMKPAGWASLFPYSLGIVRGVGSSEDGTRGMPYVTSVNNLEQLFRMLDKDRLDLVVCDSFSGLLTVRQLGLEAHVRLLTPPLQRIEIYHYLHESHKELIPRLESVIRAMQESGELERLRDALVRDYIAGKRP